MTKLLDHAGLAAAVEELTALQQKKGEKQSELNHLRSTDRGTVSYSDHENARQLEAAISALNRRIEAQKKIVADLEPVARRELIESDGLRETHRTILEKILETAKPFGAACHLLDRFYDQLNEGGMGGSCVGHCAWPFHPGVVSDPQARIHFFIKEAKEAGYDLKA